jgi:hypothetical protein
MREKRIGLLMALPAALLILGAAEHPAYAEGGPTTNTTQVMLPSAETSATYQTRQPMVDVPLLPGVQRHCSGVTCNFYFSRSETARIQRMIGGTSVASEGALNSAICLSTGPAAPVCAAGLTVNMERIKRNVKSAVDRKGCFSVRYNGLAGGLIGPPQPGLAISFANVRGNHPFCKP